MWKVALGFVLFAGLGLFILIKSGADVEMGGESHGISSHEPAASHAAPAASAASQ